MSHWGPSLVYGLCLLTSAICAGLLVRNYRRSRQPLLLWAAACFSLLAVNNLLVCLDMLVLSNVDLSAPRLATSVLAVVVLLYGFVWEVDR